MSKRQQMKEWEFDATVTYRMTVHVEAVDAASALVEFNAGRFTEHPGGEMCDWEATSGPKEVES